MALPISRKKMVSIVEGALSSGGGDGRMPLSLSSTESERARLAALLEEFPASAVPVEWVVDVADNNLNWFIATAYALDNEARTLRVASPRVTRCRLLLLPVSAQRVFNKTRQLFVCACVMCVNAESQHESTTRLEGARRAWETKRV